MAWQAINFAVSFVIITGLFALLFKMLPRVSVAWGDVIIGAVFTALLFNFGKYLIGLYIGKTGVVSGFGAAGTLIAMVLWVYYSAQIFLLGAEFTWLYAERYGSRKSRWKLKESACQSCDSTGSNPTSHALMRRVRGECGSVVWTVGMAP